MWELIKANQRRSVLLFVIMGIILIVLGFVIGLSFDPHGNGGGAIFGIIIALVVWFVMSLVAVTAGSSIMLAASDAKEVTPDVHPQLFNVVEEMRIAAGMKNMPKVYIINTDAPNAFATGMSPDKASVAVTAGLLAKLNRDELQGVIAHEMSHVVNRDVRFMTIAGVMLGSIVIISEIFLRSMIFGRVGGGGKKGGQAQIIIMLIALFFAILAPILAQLLYFSISRKREYLADASAVRLTRYPEGLASALEKISASSIDMPMANKVTAPMYICNPLKKKGMKISDLTSTHPPISERIRILREISGGAGLNNYQNAFSKITGKKSIIPDGELKKTEDIGIRTGIAVGLTDNKTTARDTNDIMMKVDNYSFINCSCGMKLKIPADFSSDIAYCPKCGRGHQVVR
jgi:heat shock protein HtpX